MKPATTAIILVLFVVQPCLAQRPLEHESIRRVVFSPCGKIFASSGTGGIKLWTIRGKLIATIDKYQGADIAFSPDGKTLASGYFTGVTLWDVDSLKELVSIKGDDPEIRPVMFSPDGALLAWRSKSAVTLWNVKDRKVIDVMKAEELREDDGLTFSRDGGSLAWANPKEIVVWDIKKRNQSMAIKAESFGAPAFNPKDDMLAWREKERITLWNTKKNEVLDRLELAFSGFLIRFGEPVFSWDGKRIAAYGVVGKDRAAIEGFIVFDVASGLPAIKQHRLAMPRSMAFSTNGDVLAFGHWNGLELHYVGPHE